jgi:hypothetical protein
MYTQIRFSADTGQQEKGIDRTDGGDRDYNALRVDQQPYPHDEQDEAGVTDQLDNRDDAPSPTERMPSVSVGSSKCTDEQIQWPQDGAADEEGDRQVCLLSENGGKGTNDCHVDEEVHQNVDPRAEGARFTGCASDLTIRAIQDVGKLPEHQRG